MQDIVLKKNWHALTAAQALDELSAKPAGLTDEEAVERRRRYGPNVLPERDHDAWWRLLLRQFNNPLLYILLFAGIISWFLEDLADAVIIFAAVLLNAGIGFFQELKVFNILRSLKRFLSYQATVMRGDTIRAIPAESVTVGDIIVLRPGDRVPADARMLHAVDVKTNEVVLTGESLPVEKSIDPVDESAPVAERSNMIFMGSTVEEGVGRAVVVAIGESTEFGRIAAMIRTEGRKDATPLQKKLATLSKLLGIIFVAISLALFIVGVATGRELLIMFLTSVSVAVAAVPESLPVALTVILAIGAQRILSRGGLVRKMLAAEALGGATVVAADKTATLTEGRLELKNLVLANGAELTPENFSGELSMRYLTLMFNVAKVEGEEELRGTSIDRAIFRAAAAAGFSREALEREYPRVGELPFNSSVKYAATLHKLPDNSYILLVLGAAEIILAISEAAHRDKLQNNLRQFAADGFKVLGLASKILPADAKLDRSLVRDLNFLSLAAFYDPIRPEVSAAVRTLQAAGLRPIMVTGDHALTAAYVARETAILSAPHRIATSSELKSLDIDKAVMDYDVFARATPEDKVNIVRALGRRGESVAMLGDGVNDAPALLEADIGVALGSGTDVAKEASDLVLINDSFVIISEAVRQGRIILDNIKKTAIFLLSSSFSELILIAGSIIFNLPLALLPAQILWVNIIEDGLPAVALAFEPEEGDVMSRKPEGVADILNKKTRRLVAFFALVTDIVLFGLFVFLYKSTGDLDYARTVVFVGLGLTVLFYVFSVWSLQQPIWRSNPFKNGYINLAVLAGLALYLVAIYAPGAEKFLSTVPLGASDWALLFGLGIFNVAVIEFGKRFFLNNHH
jgi:Ca2+-transporting ATPase